MEVILKKDIEGIGKAGHIIKVKDGYARNFLIPNGFAVYSTSANIKSLEEEGKRRSLQADKEKKEAEALAQKLSGISLTIPSLAKEDEKLYGGITSQDIGDALKEEGFSIDKNAIILDEPIKALGIYEVRIKLHQDISAKVKVWVVKK
jgi:large subunit ribosomal protein L9